MKLHQYLAVILVLLSLRASAQDDGAVELGARAGLSVSTLSRTLGRDIRLQDPEGYALGYFAGLYANLNMGNLSLQPSVILHALGAKTTEESVNGDIIDRVYGTWRLYYAQIPVNLVYNFKADDKTTFYLGGGPYIASALYGKFKPDASNYQGAESAQQLVDYFSFDARFGNDSHSNFKSFDYGLNAVAGFKLKSGFAVNAGYSRGLANAQVKGNNYLYDSAYISSITLGASFKF